MRFRFWGWLVVATAVGGICVPQVWGAAKESIELNSGWKFRQVTEDKTAVAANWLPAQVPGDVHLDLLRNKLIVDPFYGDNEKKLQWIENKDWEYYTPFPASTALLNRKNVEMVFEGLDTCAQVYINANLVLTSDNMFRTYRVNAKPYLKLGVNHVRVVFPSPIGCADKIAAKDPWRAETHTPAKDYIRKAGYEYGWDWGPRYVTSGVWQPVRLEAWDKARISDLNVRQMDVTAQTAHILAQVEVTAAMETAATIQVSYTLAGKAVHFSQQTELHPGVNHLSLPITVNHPALWYPAGYGEQPIYEFRVEVNLDGVMQDAREVKTGLRSVMLRREPDPWGRTFEFVVNGIPVFAKGANVIPFDSFPNRVTTEQMRQILQSAKDANMNMVRVWGGGYYPPQSFFDICDELGIMIWQDFMFATWPPGTYSFKQNVAQEVEDQLKRLRDHPSIVLWCGNNEQESNYGNDSRNVSTEAKVQMWEDYLTVFSGIIPTLVARYDPATPYWPSSPSADYEETKARNYRVLEDGDDVAGNYESGDTHDYSIWTAKPTTPRVPFDSELNRHYRFDSEYGSQSYPDLRTIEAYTLPQDRVNLSTPAMLSHQKHGVAGNKTIHDYMVQYYGQPKNLFFMIYASQILQAELTKTIAEHLRADQPHTMGSLYWQFNDCWPGVSGSSIDYYGRWKARQYYTRRFYAPLLVYPRLKDGNLDIYVISDKLQPVSATLRLRIMKFDGTEVIEKTARIVVPPLASHIDMHLPVASMTKEKGIDSADVFAAMDLTVEGKEVSSNLIYFVSTKQVHLPDAHIERRLTGADGFYSLDLSSKVLARDVYVSFGDVEAKTSDNYFDLLPGESMDIKINTNQNLDDLKKSMKIISLTDAFTHDSTENPIWK